MQKILLLFQTEGMNSPKREFEIIGLEVEAVPLANAEAEMVRPEFDAIILEAAANLDETRRIIESPLRPAKAALLLVVRADQLPAIDPAWPLDDFLVLPGPSDEINSRLRRAIWKRTGIDAANTLRAKQLLVDLANYKVFVADQPVTLTFKEFELLRFLMTNRGKVFTREALLNRVWGYEYFGGARTVDVHIRRLRSKIETGSTVYVETVRNVGYRFPAEA